MNKNIQLISAPSILGLSSNGVERLPESLLANGLFKNTDPHLIIIPDLNHERSGQRDPETHILNVKSLREFSISLKNELVQQLSNDHLSIILGGDCSILIGIGAALHSKGRYGLFFIDAHADFYEPEKSTTGEAADMDLAIITGRGPAILSGLNGNGPYFEDKNVIHIGQRDWEETKQHGSQDIKESGIYCYDNAMIQEEGADAVLKKIRHQSEQIDVKGFWIHFDTDVLNDEINPAVDYRLKGGLSLEQCEMILADLLISNNIIGMSVTILNPALDKNSKAAKNIVNLLNSVFRVFEPQSHKGTK